MGRLVRSCAGSGIAALLLGACALSLDGYAGPPVAAEDAGDALAPEEAADAGGDANADADADARLPFCTTLFPAPTFCDDFERTGAKGDWDNVGVSAGGHVGLGPHDGGSELVCVQPAFTSGTAGANINRFFGTMSSDLTFAFDFQVERPPAMGGMQLMAVFIQIGGDKTNQAAVFFNAQPSGLKFARQTFPPSGGQYVDTTIPASVMSYGNRQRIVMHLSLGSAPHATVTADGVTAFDDALDPFFAAGTSYFTAGIHYADPPAGPLIVHVDNVVIDLK